MRMHYLQLIVKEHYLLNQDGIPAFKEKLGNQITTIIVYFILLSCSSNGCDFSYNRCFTPAAFLRL